MNRKLLSTSKPSFLLAGKFEIRKEDSVDRDILQDKFSQEASLNPHITIIQQVIGYELENQIQYLKARYANVTNRIVVCYKMPLTLGDESTQTAIVENQDIDTPENWTLLGVKCFGNDQLPLSDILKFLCKK